MLDWTALVWQNFILGLLFWWDESWCIFTPSFHLLFPRIELKIFIPKLLQNKFLSEITFSQYFHWCCQFFNVRKKVKFRICWKSLEDGHSPPSLGVLTLILVNWSPFTDRERIKCSCMRGSSLLLFLSLYKLQPILIMSLKCAFLSWIHNKTLMMILFLYFFLSHICVIYC